MDKLSGSLKTSLACPRHSRKHERCIPDCPDRILSEPKKRGRKPKKNAFLKLYHSDEILFAMFCALVEDMIIKDVKLYDEGISTYEDFLVEMINGMIDEINQIKKT